MMSGTLEIKKAQSILDAEIPREPWMDLVPEEEMTGA